MVELEAQKGDERCRSVEVEAGVVEAKCGGKESRVEQDREVVYAQRSARWVEEESCRQQKRLEKGRTQVVQASP